MIHKFRLKLQNKLPAGGFKRNFTMTSVSKGLIFLLSLVFTPIYSRIYEPEAYGYFSLLNIVTVQFGIISSLGYADAILVTKERREMRLLSSISFFIIIITGFIYGLIFPWIILFFDKNIDTEIRFAFILLPILMALIGLCSKWAQFYNEFKFSTTQNLIVTIIIRLFGLTFGLNAKINSYGLVLSENLGRFISAVSYLVKFRSDSKRMIFLPNLKKVKYLLWTHRDYPKYLVPSRYLSILIAQLPLIFVATHYSIDTLGQLSMAMSLLSVPLSLLGNSMLPVFTRRIRDSGVEELKKLTSKVNMIITSICIVPLIIIMFSSKWIFVLFLGENWELSGTFGVIVISTMIHDLVQMIFSGIYQLKNIQKSLFIINFFAIIVFGISYYLFSIFEVQVELAMLFFVILRMFYSMAKSLRLFFLLGLRKDVVINFISGGIIILTLLYVFI